MRLTRFVERAARLTPERMALVADDGACTFAELDRAVRRTGALLARHGLGADDRIAILSPNCARAWVALLSVFDARAVWVPVNAKSPARANVEFLDAVGCTALVLHEEHAGDEAAYRAGVPGLRTVVPMAALAGSLAGDPVDRGGDGAAAPPAVPAGPGAEPDTESPERVVTIIGSGGTSGRPKGAVWRQRTLDCMAASFLAAMPPGDDPVHLCAAPMTHAAGAVALSLLPAGATQVLLPRPDPEAVLDAVARHGATHLYVPPTVLYRLLAHPGVRDADTSSLRYLVLAGAPCAPDKLAEAVDVFGPVVGQVYGQVEAPMFITCFHPRDVADAAAAGGRRHRLASCGRPGPFADVAVMGEDGRLLPAGGRGEIVVRSDLVMAGYHGSPGAAAAAGPHGWHRTGDVGRIDADGFVYIVDRKRDLIITGGFNVYPNEVERAVLELPQVQDVAVVGVPDAGWGEAVKAVVELKRGARLEPEAVVRHCKERLGSVKAPKSVEFWDELPRSPVGKVLKRAVRERFWEGRDRSV